MNHKEWKPWTTENYNYLYCYAQNKLNDTKIVQDLIQDISLVALENYGRFGQRSAELTCLTVILKHKIYRVYRSRAKIAGHISPSDGLAGQGTMHRPVAIASHDAEDPLVAKEFSDALRINLLSLPLPWQQVYELRFVKGLKADKMCNALHLTPENYWVISHRLKGALKSCILSTGNNSPFWVDGIFRRVNGVHMVE